MSPSPDAVTAWIERLKANDPRAASILWEQFASRLLATARGRLRGAPRRVADEDDVAVKAFAAFLQAVQNGRLPQLKNRDDLWAVLLTIVCRTGGSLEKLLKNGPLSTERSATLVATLARAVAAAHAAGVVHRDLKPANVLLSFSRDAESSERSALWKTATRSAPKTPRRG